MNPTNVHYYIISEKMDKSLKELSDLFERGVRDYIVQLHPLELAKNHSRGTPEFEVRFGTDARTKYTKVDYDSVVREVKKNGWKPEENIQGTLLLRITTEMPESSAGVTVPLNDESELFGGARQRQQQQQTNYKHTPAANGRTYRMANIRAELVGKTQVEAYCKSNDLEKVHAQIPGANKVIKFTQKLYPDRKIGLPGVNGEAAPTLAFSDFNFRVSSQFEKEYGLTDATNPQIRSIVEKWTTLRKHFRCMNRVRFRHPDSLVMVDVSIVKSNRTYTDKKTNKAIPIPALTTTESGVFTNPESYEIELELDNERVTKLISEKTMTMDQLHTKLMKQIRSAIRVVLSGLQETNYPIPLSEQTAVINEYMRCLCGEKWENGRINPETKDRYPAPYFCGYSPVTLQLEHTVCSSSDTGKSDSDTSKSDSDMQVQEGGAPKPKIKAAAAASKEQISICTDYCVTEKADGARALLFVSNTGKIYMINTNMKVIFTGSKTDEKKCHRTIIDGEFIAYNTSHEMLSLYAAFDVYVVGSMPTANIRALPFGRTIIPDGKEDNYRLCILDKIVTMMQPKSVIEDMTKNGCVFQIRTKRFYFGLTSEVSSDETKSIFEQSAEIWRRQHLFEYEIDGLIFTPSNLGVGGSVPLNDTQLNDTNNLKDANKSQGNQIYFAQAKKFAWNRSFKWKPPHYNTIDFLVRTVKGGGGSGDKLFTTRLDDGQLVQYKRLILHCGFDEKRDRLANPVHNMLHDTASRLVGAVDEKQPSAIQTTMGYRPAPFIPATPYDHSAQYCNVAVREGDLFMRTDTNEVFSDEMIVEFKYNLTSSKATNPTEEGAWNWVPIRVRYDKTSLLKSGKSEYGNSYAVANNNWKSIHFPVTEQIICGEDQTDTRLAEEQVYYNRAQTSVGNETQAMRDFHNLYVKRELIARVCKYANTAMGHAPILMDFAVGKAGDLSKWKHANVDFVFGVDIAKDNIMNEYDGAITRYLSTRTHSPQHPLRAIFIHGNSGLNIRSTGQAFYTDQDRQIAQAIFGDGGADVQRQVAPKYARIGSSGFDVSSIQFALHYMFQNGRTLHHFLRNLAECTKLNGYFIGTCYNGANVFKLLQGKPVDGSVVYTKNGKKIFEVVKKYSEDLKEIGVGVAIDVYQESIDNMIREYLVNFEFLESLLREYGFAPMPEAECVASGIGNAHRSSFRKLHDECKKARANKQTSRMNEFGLALEMSAEEKNISFLNEIFVYKKVVQISPADMKALVKRYGTDDSIGGPVTNKPTNANTPGAEVYARKLPGHYIVI